MNGRLSLELVIPLYNEARNIERLLEGIRSSGLLTEGLESLILVDNGSQDSTGGMIQELGRRHRWIRPVIITPNNQYGGGIYEGFRHTCAEFVGMMPGDNQVAPGDLLRVWQRLVYLCGQVDIQSLLVKGHRTKRQDGMNTRLAGAVYTMLANRILGLGVRDVNGLPKIFHRSLLDMLPRTRMKTFTFDAQLLETARRNDWMIEEVEVKYLARDRRAGVSSRSQKQMASHRETISQLFEIRRLRSSPTIPMIEAAANASVGQADQDLVVE